MTEKLYWKDPYCRRFDAHAVRRMTVSGHPAVILDRTAFYPTSGGQPFDTGFINNIAVIDVSEDENTGDIVHVLDGELPTDDVEGVINWERRFNHMQQHSGQHILSQAFERVLDAPTLSFHLGSEVCTIDLPKIDVTPDDIAKVEDLANSIVFANAEIRVHEVTQDDLARFPLRKPPVVSGLIRIVEVNGFDYSPCGGTHVRSAGEIGLIKIRRWERRSDALRVDFYCGWRALFDYRWKNETVNSLAATLSVKDRELGEAVERTIAQARENFHQLEEAHKRLLELEARVLIAETPVHDGVRLITRVFDDRTGEDVRRLAMALTTTPATIALLGVRGCDRASLIFARSSDLPHDMNALLKSIMPIISGRGGGIPSLAQGGGPGLDKLDEAIATARSLLSGW